MFLDESRFNLSHSDGRARVYRRQNERYADCCVQERDRFGGGSVMVWAGITSRRRTNLVFVDSTLTAARYRDNILAVEVVNFLNHNGPGITFQQDMQDRTRQELLRFFFSNRTSMYCLGLQNHQTSILSNTSGMNLTVVFDKGLINPSHYQNFVRPFKMNGTIFHRL